MRPDARPQARKNRRRIRWNTLRIFSSRERRRWLRIIRRNRTVNVGQAPKETILAPSVSREETAVVPCFVWAVKSPNCSAGGCGKPQSSRSADRRNQVMKQSREGPSEAISPDWREGQHVALLMVTLGGGGVQRSMLHLARALADRRHHHGLQSQAPAETEKLASGEVVQSPGATLGEAHQFTRQEATPGSSVSAFWSIRILDMM